MSDIFTKEKRSLLMAAIRSSGNKNTELRLVKIFRQHGIVGWRRRQPLLGKPDFVFRRQRLAIFVDGCFWHGCPKHGHRPSSNRTFWLRKLRRNRARDLVVTRYLRQKGWKVLRLWEHDLAWGRKCASRVRSTLKSLEQLRGSE